MNPALARIGRGLLRSCRGVVLPVELPEPAADGVTYLTTRQAARVARVADCTITSWKKKKLLIPVPQSPPRKPLYRLEDVHAAEHRAWQRAIEASGTDSQIARRHPQPRLPAPKED